MFCTGVCQACQVKFSSFFLWPSNCFVNSHNSIAPHFDLQENRLWKQELMDPDSQFLRYILLATQACKIVTLWLQDLWLASKILPQHSELTARERPLCTGHTLVSALGRMASSQKSSWYFFKLHFLWCVSGAPGKAQRDKTKNRSLEWVPLWLQPQGDMVRKAPPEPGTTTDCSGKQEVVWRKDVSVITDLWISYLEVPGLELTKERIFLRKQGDSPIASETELCKLTQLKFWRKIRQKGPAHLNSLPVFV